MEFLRNLLELLKYDIEKPMLFTSGAFFLFFSIFIIFYTLFAKKKWFISVYVIIFSLFFYYKSSGIYFSILILTTVTNFTFAYLLETTKKKAWRTFWLIVGVLPSFALLGYFKYTNFILFNWAQIIQSNFSPLDIFLPVGISFYTFQSVSYVFDVYWKKLKPTKNILDYAFFLSFFPQLVAGPIVKAHHFIPQLQKARKVTKQAVYLGLWLIMIGLFKKAIIADYISQYNDLIFAAPHTYNGFENLMGVIGYTLQIYCDFSGYSDMAIGLGAIMGFDLGVNFNFPYKARNITDFWKRWHISLSTWFRDYLFLPVAYAISRKLKNYKYLGIKTEFWIYLFSIMITFLLCGLWHGADWQFIFWGGMHGIALIIHKSTKKIIRKKIHKNIFTNSFFWLLTFIFVVVMWIFFRATSIEINTSVSQMINGVETEIIKTETINAFQTAWLILKNIFTDFDFMFATHFWKARYMWVIFVVIGFVMHSIPEKWNAKLIGFYIKSPFIFKLILFIISVQIVIQFRNEDVQPFIYFQF